MQEIIEISKQIRKIKIGKGIKDYNRRKEPILINTSKIKINGEIGIKDYIASKRPILLITLKMEKINKINLFTTRNPTFYDEFSCHAQYFVTFCQLKVTKFIIVIITLTFVTTFAFITIYILCRH